MIMNLKVGFLIQKSTRSYVKKDFQNVFFAPQKKINKSIMAPTILNSKEKDNQTDKINKNLKSKKNKLLSLRKYVEKNFDYVGKDFGKKVREVYYDKKSKKAIYGTTTPKEREELAEEGIDLLSIPWVNKNN